MADRRASFPRATFIIRGLRGPRVQGIGEAAMTTFMKIVSYALAAGAVLTLAMVVVQSAGMLTGS
jgi:hypothetical protein